MMARPTNVRPLGNRAFLRTGAAGLTLIYGKNSSAQPPPSDVLNLALVGCGIMGEMLFRALSHVHEVPFRWSAVCDLLETKALAATRKLNLPHSATSKTAYTELETMLREHPEIDAVFIATPDWLHEPMTTMCLRAGKHAYSETMMALTVAGAANMVRSQRETGKLLQIGYQARSNPRYQRCKTELIDELKLCGRITHGYSQWNRGVNLPWTGRYPKQGIEAMVAAGYPDAFQYQNWRHFSKFTLGPCAIVGSYGIDIMNWYLGTPPKRVMATGGRDYYQNMPLAGKLSFTSEHMDNVFAVFEYDVPGNGPVRVLSHVIGTNSSEQRYEKFMGDKGTILLSESGYEYGNRVFREAWDSDGVRWHRELRDKRQFLKNRAYIHHKFWEREKTWHEPPKWLAEPMDPHEIAVKESQPLDEYVIPWQMNLPYHTPHVDNFLQTVRNRGKQSDLNCPAEEAYKTFVTVVKASELAVQGGGSYEFKGEDFLVL